MIDSAASPNQTSQNQPHRPRVLVSDDQHDILAALSLLLKINNFGTQTVDSPAGALEAAKDGKFDLVLMDLNYSRDTTSGQEGLDLLSGLRRSGVNAPIVVMTAWGNVELAVEAMRLGAADFVQKPWDNHRLLSTLRKQLDRAEEELRERQRKRSELEIARHVQQKLLPQDLKPLRTLEYAAICIPAREVGGDYYDFFYLGEEHFAGLLADVSGKGVAAAMLMANLQACFRSQFDLGLRDTATLLETVNRLFHASTPAEQYVTLFFFEYDDYTRKLRYVNCGHVAPVLIRTSGEVLRLDSTNTVIGLFPTCCTEVQELALEANDVLVLFTDGATEFLDKHEEEFGDGRFVDLAASARRLNPKAAVDHVAQHLQSQAGPGEQFDDQTIVILRGR
jgi:phosphoserine phosphatase RsbU/P